MIKIGARSEQDGKTVKRRKERKRSASEEEVSLLKDKEHTEIADIDIRENTKQRIRFRKLPWAELILTIVFLGAALAIFIYMQVRKERLGKM